MSRKREILELLTADELRALADRFALELTDRRAKDGMVDALSRAHRVKLDDALTDYPRARLKELCRGLDLDDSGKEKQPIVARLLGQAPVDDPDEADDDDEDADADEAADVASPPEAPARPARGKRAAAKKGGDLGFEATLWQAADKLRNNMDAAEYKHVVLGLIFLKYISDAFEELHARLVADEPTTGCDPEDRDEYRGENVFWVPKPARWSAIQAAAKQPSIGQLIDDAMVAIERDNPSLKGALPKNYGRPGLDKQRLGELVDLIGTIGLGGKEQQAKDVLGRVYEYFLSEFALAEGKKGGQFYTPGSVVRVLVAMLAPYKGRVYDPCCGSGGMFVQSEKFVEQHGGRLGAISVYGQESNETTWKLARMNLAIRGIEANLGAEHADTFHRDQHPELKADYILANPPFNDSDWGQDRLTDDVRWKYGTPPAGNANKIAGTYHAWRGDQDAATYADVAGFCKSATLDDVRGHQHVLTPGRYVGAEEVEDDSEPFETRFPKLVAKLEAQFAEGRAIEARLRKGLGVMFHGQ